ncbi:MAG: HAMP domain-containing sensor histidine kinase [Gemmatimonadales bacterium]
MIGPPIPDADALYDGAACGLLVTRQDGLIQRANATFCRWLGVDAADLVGERRIQDMLTVGGKIFHQTHWAPMLQMQGSIAEMKLDVVSSSGRPVPMLFNVVRRHGQGESWDELSAMVVNDRQAYERALLTARNEARAANEQLSLVDRRKDEFFATLAHELRNPLAPIRSVVEILKRLPSDNPVLARSHAILEGQVAQLSHLIDDLLEVSRLNHGKVSLRIEAVPVAEAIGIALDAAHPHIERAGHDLAYAPPSNDLLIAADPVRVTQMILNLLNNAAKYTPDGGTITIDVEPSEHAVAITISDTGIGMTSDQLLGVFDMFGQIIPDVNRSEGGLGIGLALVRGLAERHGGSVSAQSDGLGKGSEFTLVLPRVCPGQFAQPRE